MSVDHDSSTVEVVTLGEEEEGYPLTLTGLRLGDFQELGRLKGQT